MRKRKEEGVLQKSEGNMDKTVLKDVDFEFSIKKEDILNRADFGSFEIVLTKYGAMFKNYTGFHVWTSPYSVGLDGVAHENSLYGWLVNLVKMKESFSAVEDEAFSEEPSLTNGDILYSSKIITEANLVRPMTVFVDFDEAAISAISHMKWLEKMQEELKKAISSGLPDENIKENAEFNAKVHANEILKLLEKRC